MGEESSYSNENAAQTSLANTNIQGLQTRADQLGQQGINEANFGRNIMSGLIGPGGMVNQAIGSAQGYNPNAAFGSFMSQAPALQQMAYGNYSPMTAMLNQQAGDQAQQSIRNTASQFADKGALNSGAAAAAMGQAGARPFADVQNQLGMQQLGLSGQLLGTQQQINPQQQQFMQSNLQNAFGRGIGTQMGFGQSAYGAGNQMQNSALQGYGQAAGMATQLGTPEYVYNPSGFEKFMGGAQQIVNLGAGGAQAVAGAGGANGFGLWGPKTV